MISPAIAGNVAEGDQHATPLIEQFHGVPIGGRHDGISQSVAVGERSRRHLCFIEIGRHVDVTHRNEVHQHDLVDKLVEEDHVVLKAEFVHARLQALAIRLSLFAHEIWVSGAENDIEGVRA